MANNNRRFGGWFGSSGFGGAGGGAAGGGGGLLSGGKLIFLGFIGLIIGGGFLFTGGNPFPKNQLTKPAPGTYEIDEESLKELEDGKRNLQLKTIRFKECKGQASATLLVDRSGSMEGQKITLLRDALNGFVNQMGDSSVTGLISYSTDVREDVPIDLFSNNSAQMRNGINNLRPNGGTGTRNAFSFALPRILNAKERFPDKQHVVVFISDGIPESIQKTCTAPACSPDGNRCFETTQDPTNTSVGADISQQIKDAGIRIFAITLLDSKDTCFQDDLTAMMQRVASPDSYYQTPNPEDLDKIYSEISTKICESVK